MIGIITQYMRDNVNFAGRLLPVAFAVVAVSAPLAVRPLNAVRTPSPSQPAGQPSFDVASIKERDPHAPLGVVGIQTSPGRLIDRCATLSSRFIGKQRICRSTRSSSARAVSSSSLLIRRMIHQERQVRAVVRDDRACRIIVMGSAPISEFAGSLGGIVGRPVIDKTGLAATYYFEFKWAGDTSPTSSLPSLPTALKEQFGLELKSERGQVDTLVIDHVEKPSQN